jgi:tyrosyl-tRNA synthetase
MSDIEKAIEQLNNAVTVSAAIQERHAQLLSEHAEMLHGVHKSLLAQNKSALTYIEHAIEAALREQDIALHEKWARERSRERDYEGRIDRRRDVV